LGGGKLATTKKKKEKKNVFEGKVFIQATFNNTIITVTDIQGNIAVLGERRTAWFRGAKKSTPYAAQTTAEAAVKPALDQGLHEVHVL
jgi:small subunit ribosomal protein S11